MYTVLLKGRNLYSNNLWLRYSFYIKNTQLETANTNKWLQKLFPSYTITFQIFLLHLASLAVLVLKDLSAHLKESFQTLFPCLSVESGKDCQLQYLFCTYSVPPTVLSTLRTLGPLMFRRIPLGYRTSDSRGL